MNIFKISLAAGVMVFTMINCTAQDTEVVQDNISLVNKSEMFTSRDLRQAVDLNGAVELELISGQDILIDKEGIYVLSGNVSNTVVVVEAHDEAKVQLVLKNLSISNRDRPAIYVKSADKVFITTREGENRLSVSEEYEKDGNSNLDGVIFSRSDLVLNGSASLEIISEKGNGISAKDDLKITGGVLKIQAHLDGLEANDSLRIYNGNIYIKAGADALHSENSNDPLLGYIYIQGGTLEIDAADDAIRGNSFVQIDGGQINIKSSQEGVEATHIQINGGMLTINASDDGINATAKTAGPVLIEVYGGDISINMARGDTDGFDSNGDLSIYGGTISVNGQSTFDVDGQALFLDGQVTVNGTVVRELPRGRAGRGRP